MISVVVDGSVVLRWQAPTQEADGSPLPGLSGYKIHYGSESRDYSEIKQIGANAGTQHTLSLPPGEYYFAMTAVGLNGSESDYSNEVRRVIN